MASRRYKKDAAGRVVEILCRGCGEWKSVDEYHKDRRDTVAQRQTQCKTCSLLKLRSCAREHAEGFRRFSFSISPERADMLDRYAKKEGVKPHVLLREWVGAIIEGRMWYV